MPDLISDKVHCQPQEQSPSTSNMPTRSSPPATSSNHDCDSDLQADRALDEFMKSRSVKREEVEISAPILFPVVHDADTSTKANSSSTDANSLSKNFSSSNPIEKHAETGFKAVSKQEPVENLNSAKKRDRASACEILEVESDEEVDDSEYVEDDANDHPNAIKPKRSQDSKKLRKKKRFDEYAAELLSYPIPWGMSRGGKSLNLADEPAFKEPKKKRVTAQERNRNLANLRNFMSSAVLSHEEKPDESRATSKAASKAQLRQASSRKAALGLTNVVTEVEGGWKMYGMKCLLNPAQLLAVAFMRGRELKIMYHAKNPPHGYHPYGGILADATGTGKTITSIATIVDGLPDGRSKSRPTLIVVPPNLVAQWLSEISKHAVDLDALQYTAQHRINGVSGVTKVVLESVSVVVTTYTEVKKSWSPPTTDVKSKGDEWHAKLEEDLLQNRGALHHMEFQRIIFDEGNILNNWSSDTSISCRALQANFRWIVSATPVKNALEDFYGLMLCLRVPHIGGRDNFAHNFCEFDIGRQRLLKLVGEITIRRDCLQVIGGEPVLSLPTALRSTQFCSLDPFSSLCYQKLRQVYIREINALLELPRAPGASIFRFQQRLKQCATHPLLVRDELRKFIGQGKIKGLLGRLRLFVKEGVYTEEYERDWRLILTTLEPYDAFPEEEEESTPLPASNEPRLVPDEEEEKFDKEKPSTKSSEKPIRKKTPVLLGVSKYSPILKAGKFVDIVRQIRTWFSAASDAKIIVFFDSLEGIQILTALCRQLDIAHLVYDGNKSAEQRNEFLQRFTEAIYGVVLIASIRSGGTGLNIQCASRVLIADLWWNVTREVQAFGRVLRYGQENEVELIRMAATVANIRTVDQELVVLQKAKAAAIDNFFETDCQALPQLTLEERLSLFGEVYTNSDGKLCIYEENGDENDDDDLDDFIAADEDMPMEMQNAGCDLDIMSEIGAYLNEQPGQDTVEVPANTARHSASESGEAEHVRGTDCTLESEHLGDGSTDIPRGTCDQ